MKQKSTRYLSNTHYYKYQFCILDMLKIQLVTYNVTVLDTTTILVTIFTVCLCSRRKKN